MKREGVEDSESDLRAVRLKWVRRGCKCFRGDLVGSEGGGGCCCESEAPLMLQSFEMVPMATEPEPEPSAQLCMAATALLASMIDPATPLVITSIVPLLPADHSCSHASASREPLLPTTQMRLHAPPSDGGYP